MRTSTWAVLATFLFILWTAPQGESRGGDITAEADYVFRGLAGELQDDWTEPTLLPTAPRCTTNSLRIISDGLYFVEDAAESACGLATYAPPWPAHARTAVVTFNASRHMDSDPRAEPPPPGFLQTLELWDAKTASLVYRHHVYQPTMGNASLAPHVVEMDLQGVGEPYLKWHFMDRGMAVGDTYSTSGIGWRAETYDIEVRVHNVPLPLEPGRETVGVEGTDAVTRKSVSWTLEPRHDDPVGTTFSMRVHVPAAFTWERLEGPNGQELVPSRVVTEEEGTTLVFGPSSFTAGTYSFYTASHTPVTVVPQILPLSMLLSVMPLVAATDLGRTSFYRGHSATRLFGPAEIGGIVAGTAWGMFVVWTVLTHRIPLVSSWPLGLFGLWFYGILLGVSVLVGTSWVFHRRRLFAGLRDHADHVAARSADLEHFLASVTHDLKSPLLALDWLARDLQEELAQQATDPLVIESLERIRRNVGGMDTLVKDLLELQQVDQDVAQDEVVEVGREIDQVLDALHGQIRARGSTVTVEPLEVGSLRVAPSRLRQVFSNLIGNAIKYGREDGGQVVVGVFLAPGRACRIEIRDDGPGIPPEEWDSVFEIFQRGANASAGTTEGTGIGLAIVRRIVEGWGGKVWADVGPEGGARFCVLLPHDRVA